MSWGRACPFTPENTSYNVTFGCATTRTVVMSGPAKYRKSFVNAPTVFDVQWLFNAAQFKQFMDYYRKTLREGSLLASVNLIGYNSDSGGDGPVVMRDVHFVPGSLKITQQRGHAYIVTAQLEDNGTDSWQYQ